MLHLVICPKCGERCVAHGGSKVVTHQRRSYNKEAGRYEKTCGYTFKVADAKVWVKPQPTPPAEEAANPA